MNFKKKNQKKGTAFNLETSTNNVSVDFKNESFTITKDFQNLTKFKIPDTYSFKYGKFIYERNGSPSTKNIVYGDELSCTKNSSIFLTIGSENYGVKFCYCITEKMFFCGNTIFYNKDFVLDNNYPILKKGEDFFISDNNNLLLVVLYDNKEEKPDLQSIISFCEENPQCFYDVFNFMYPNGNFPKEVDFDKFNYIVKYFNGEIELNEFIVEYSKNNRFMPVDFSTKRGSIHFMKKLTDCPLNDCVDDKIQETNQTDKINKLLNMSITIPEHPATSKLILYLMVSFTSPDIFNKPEFDECRNILVKNNFENEEVYLKFVKVYYTLLFGEIIFLKDYLPKKESGAHIYKSENMIWVEKDEISENELYDLTNNILKDIDLVDLGDFYHLKRNFENKI